MKQVGSFNLFAMKNFSDGVSSAVESGKKYVAAGTLALAAAATTQSAVANTISITDPTLMATNSQNVAMETWEAKFLSEITLSGGVSNPFLENGTTLMAITDPDGNMIGAEGTFTRLNDGPNSNWITLTGNEFDELGNITNTGLNGTIGLLSIGDIATLETIMGPQTGNILHTTIGDMVYIGSGFVPTIDARFTISRPGTVSSVPAPAAVWLFASGLPLVAAAARRRSKRGDIGA